MMPEIEVEADRRQTPPIPQCLTGMSVSLPILRATDSLLGVKPIQLRI
jgi:hypothetical protein